MSLGLAVNISITGAGITGPTGLSLLQPKDKIRITDTAKAETDRTVHFFAFISESKPSPDSYYRPMEFTV